jgi:hypothetical protein
VNKDYKKTTTLLEDFFKGFDHKNVRDNCQGKNVIGRSGCQNNLFILLSPEPRG